MKRSLACLAGVLTLGFADAATTRLDGLTLETGEIHVSPTTVHVSTLLTNAGRHPVNLGSRPIWHPQCGLTIVVSGVGTGRRAVAGELDRCEPVEEIIAPGSSVEVSRSLDRSEWFPAPGRYTVLVQWKEPGKGVLESTPVTVVIPESTARR